MLVIEALAVVDACMGDGMDKLLFLVLFCLFLSHLSFLLLTLCVSLSLCSFYLKCLKKNVLGIFEVPNFAADLNWLVERSVLQLEIALLFPNLHFQQQELLHFLWQFVYLEAPLDLKKKDYLLVLKWKN